MAYCLGLIGKEVFENLKGLGQIRNRFAHSHLSIEFDDAEVLALCKGLVFPRAGENEDQERQYIAWALYDDGPRHRFTSIVMLVALELMHVIENINNFSRRTRAPDRWLEPSYGIPFTTVKNYIEKGFHIDKGKG